MVQKVFGIGYGKVLFAIAVLLILFVISAYAYLRLGPVPVAVTDPALPLKKPLSGSRLERVPLVRIKTLLLLPAKMYLYRAHAPIGNTVRCATVIPDTTQHLPDKCSQLHHNSGRSMVLMVSLA
jgi:hypothetical protein